ncbi:hypothetical protein PENSPDRAFT_659569 [Peniophora sp. CONT]|nr:hypothetical protein PENSPDRAFT_659569 [Peniophora sp. CONT]
MTALHTYFALRNQQAFQRLLEGSSRPTAGQAGTSSSGGRSWGRPSPLAAAAHANVDVNARDALGRTVLHLACAAIDAAALHYVRLLLAAPTINVNLLDAESHWSALHRALYNGNLGAAILLLQRADTDVGITDVEGHTAFDLYNSTIPLATPAERLGTDRVELLTWGTNRNAALGHPDGDDRAYPEVVPLLRSDQAGGRDSFKKSVAFRLKPASAVDVRMSRLHTVTVTDEPQNNVRVCGFASTGRLGPGGGQHTQYQLAPMQNFEYTIIAVALGQDHTLALTSSGTVLSWGLNRFSQLGYVVEAGAKGDDQVQVTPKPILGPLKRERVVGVAACKTASACWTDTVLYSWGKNGGQLGYDKAAQPVQVVPRIVSKVTKPVVNVTMTDSAMACLLNTSDVVLLFNDGHMRVNFPVEMMTTSDFHAYRPPHAVYSTKIEKILCSDNLFAAISTSGDLFTFLPPSAADTEKDARTPVRPQRVAALRKQWGPVRDAALSADGTIIVCTAAGYVYVRARGTKDTAGRSGSKAFRFVRVPHVHRAVAVRANETGAFAALRVTDKPEQVDITGNTLAQDIAKVAPYLCFERVQEEDIRSEPGQPRPLPPYAALAPTVRTDDEDGEDDVATSISEDIVALARLWDILTQDKLSRKRYDGAGLFERPGAKELSHGADLMIRLQSGAEIPAHELVLALRCPTLKSVLAGSKSAAEGISIKYAPSAAQSAKSRDPADLPRLIISGVQPLAVMVVLHYLYSDTLLALNDPRVSRVMAPLLVSGKVQPAQIVKDTERFANALGLPHIAEATRWVAKRAMASSMQREMRALFRAASLTGALRPDVVLHLADGEVHLHSLVLRARSPFFETMLDDHVWTRERWGTDSVLNVDLRHIENKYMDYILRFMCCGEEAEMFERLDFIETADQYLDLLFGVMYTANELLLERLLLVCASLVLKYITPHNISAVYTDASNLDCAPLHARLHDYMATGLETLLDGNLLDELHPRLVKSLSVAIRDAQADHMRRARVGTMVEIEMLMDKYKDWLDNEDFPVPIVRTAAPRNSPKLSPKASRNRRTSLPGSPTTSPSIRPGLSSIPVGGDEDLFTMDDVPALNLDSPAVPPTTATPAAAPEVKGASPWKSKATPQRVDMKSILAETEAKTRPTGVYRPPLKDASSAAFPPIGSSANTLQGTMPRPPPSTVQTPPRVRPSPQAAATPPQRPVTLSKSSPVANSAQPGLGPTITPTKQTRPSPGPVVRNASSGGGRAWTLAPVRPVVEPTPSATQSRSFAEIQRLQREQDTVPVRDKRTLKEIQDEERERQQETDFMRWWAAEEERVRQEQEADARAIQRAMDKGKKPGKPRGKKEGGAKEGTPRKPSGAKKGDAPQQDVAQALPAASSSSAPSAPPARAAGEPRAQRSRHRAPRKGPADTANSPHAN